MAKISDGERQNKPTLRCTLRAARAPHARLHTTHTTHPRHHYAHTHFTARPSFHTAHATLTARFPRTHFPLRITRCARARLHITHARTHTPPAASTAKEKEK